MIKRESMTVSYLVSILGFDFKSLGKGQEHVLVARDVELTQKEVGEQCLWEMMLEKATDYDIAFHDARIVCQVVKEAFEPIPGGTRTVTTKDVTVIHDWKCLDHELAYSDLITETARGPKVPISERGDLVEGEAQA